jgi:uncharacterized protein (TIGR03067 family)
MTCVKPLGVCLTVLLAGLLGGATLATAQDQTREQELQALKGKWVVVRIIGPDGKETREETGDAMTFFPKKGVVTWGDSDVGGMDIDHTFTIDPTKRPRWMDISGRSEDETSRFIYKIQGDELWIGSSNLYYKIRQGNEKRPAAFKGTFVSIWKRAK